MYRETVKIKINSYLTIFFIVNSDRIREKLTLNKQSLKSSSGHYFIGIDHIRALAVYLVYTWHFTHFNTNHYNPPPAFPLSIFSEGHTGVALFMVLSGYLFAKLTFDRNIHYPAFLWNRFLRLAPLLLLVFFIVGVVEIFSGNDFWLYLNKLWQGFIYPTWPNGGWSITAEFHFYVLLPVLLFIARKNRYLLLAILLLAVLVRLVLFLQKGEVQTLSYWTIIGRIDQFLLGIAGFYFRDLIKSKHLWVFFVFFTFLLFYRYFDIRGGFMENPVYPSPSHIWIYLPTMEGIAYATLIAWYDQSFRHSQGLFSRFIAAIGAYSYSIYLLHFFMVFATAEFMHRHIVQNNWLPSWGSFYQLWLLSTISFIVMIPIAYISYHFFESYFLKYRKKYLKFKD